MPFSRNSYINYDPQKETRSYSYPKKHSIVSGWSWIIARLGGQTGLEAESLDCPGHCMSPLRSVQVHSTTKRICHSDRYRKALSCFCNVEYGDTPPLKRDRRTGPSQGRCEQMSSTRRQEMAAEARPGQQQPAAVRRAGCSSATCTESDAARTASPRCSLR